MDASLNTVSDVSPRQLHQRRLSELYVQFRVSTLIHTIHQLSNCKFIVLIYRTQQTVHICGECGRELKNDSCQIKYGSCRSTYHSPS